MDSNTSERSREMDRRRKILSRHLGELVTVKRHA